MKRLITVLLATTLLAGPVAAHTTCLGEDLETDLEGATEVVRRTEDVQSAQFAGTWQEGRMGGFVYRVAADHSGMVAKEFRDPDWRIDLQCDVAAGSCTQDMTGWAPQAARDLADKLAACIINAPPPAPEPAPEAAPEQPTDTAMPEAAAEASAEPAIASETPDATPEAARDEDSASETPAGEAAKAPPANQEAAPGSQAADATPGESENGAETAQSAPSSSDRGNGEAPAVAETAAPEGTEADVTAKADTAATSPEAATETKASQASPASVAAANGSQGTQPAPAPAVTTEDVIAEAPPEVPADAAPDVTTEDLPPASRPTGSSTETGQADTAPVEAPRPTGVPASDALGPDPADPLQAAFQDTEDALMRLSAELKAASAIRSSEAAQAAVGDTGAVLARMSQSGQGGAGTSDPTVHEAQTVPTPRARNTASEAPAAAHIQAGPAAEITPEPQTTSGGEATAGVIVTAAPATMEEPMAKTEIPAISSLEEDEGTCCAPWPTTSEDLVETLQALLKEAGFDPGAIDGGMGPKTQAALVEALGPDAASLSPAEAVAKLAARRCRAE